MMKLWSGVCFLVLAISPLSRGLKGADPSQVTESQTDQTDLSTVAATTPSITVTPSNTSEERAAPTPLDNTNRTVKESYAREDGNDSTTAQTTTASGEPGGTEKRETADVTTSAPMAAMSSSKPAGNLDKGPSSGGKHVEKSQSSGGYVILVMILLVIIILCVILYLLRRSSRTYSFDLQRPLPVNHRDEPTGTFEPVRLDDLEPPAEYEAGTTDDLSPPPVVNGAAPQTEENGSNGLSEQQDANGLETWSMSNTGPSVSDQPVGTASSPLDSINLLCDAAGEEQQNENNNHPFCSDDPSVDINIDEPTWSDLPLS